MAEYYFPSNDIYVFPCANRGNKSDAGVYTTEYNLTHLAKLSDTYIVSAPTGTGGWVQCFVRGYFFRFEVPNDLGWNELYFQICLSDNTIANDVAGQSKLVNFVAGGGTNESLDIGDQFKAARLTNSAPTANNNYIQLKDASGWLPALQSIKTEMIDDGAVTTNKLHPSAVTADKIDYKAVIAAKLGNNVIDSQFVKLGDAAANKFQVRLVGGDGQSIKVQLNGSVGMDDIDNGAISTNKFASNAVAPKAETTEAVLVGAKSYTLSLSGNVLTLTEVR